MSHLWPPQSVSSPDYISSPPPQNFIEKQQRNLVILGSTGSIGKNALAVVDKANKNLKVIGLAAGKNIALLAEQAIRFKPDYLAVLNKDLAEKLQKLLPNDYRPKILFGRVGYAEVAALPEADCILSAQVGAAGLAGTLAAAKAGKVIALANKESLVLAGGLLRKICAQTGASLLPVDSEHYAIFQCISGRPETAVKSLILTASGGPFFGKTVAEIQNVRPEQALKHPNWNMGAKISIDSATMMNKGLELIEAMHLYGISPDKIRILIHPQSIVHSLVEFNDNSLLAQMATPDMQLPIAACLLWPHCKDSFVKGLDLTATNCLTFKNPDLDLFKCLALAQKAASYKAEDLWQTAGLNPACIILNAANEAAVELFLNRKCGFGQIPKLVALAIAQMIETDQYKELQWSPGKYGLKFEQLSNYEELAMIIEALDRLSRQVVKEAIAS